MLRYYHPVGVLHQRGGGIPVRAGRGAVAAGGRHAAANRGERGAHGCDGVECPHPKSPRDLELTLW